MRNALMVVGRRITSNEALLEYIKREYQKRVVTIDAVIALGEHNKDLFLEISKAYEQYDNLLIATAAHNYPTVAKVIATLFHDTLTLQDHLLAPSKAERIEPDSFLIGKEHKINLIKVEPLQRLAPILLHNEVEAINLYLIDVDPETFHKDLDELAQKMEVSYVATPLTEGLYKIGVYNRPYGNIAGFTQEVQNLYPKESLIAHDLFEYLIDRLSAAKKSLTFAESCTGGLLASMLTRIPGSSKIFHGSLITYANDIKEAWLGVSHQTLIDHGAVSEETVQEMLAGALKRTAAHYAIAISGIAGPGGATPTKPVGTVVVGCRSKEQQIIKTKRFFGDRNYIQYQAAMYGIKLLCKVAQEDLL